MVDIYYNNSYNMMVFRNSKQKVYFNKIKRPLPYFERRNTVAALQ